MTISTFDTHKFVRRLEAAGMPLELAEIQAEVLTEAFNVNLESLVNKDYLAAQFAEQRAYLETRFAQQDTKIDSNHRVFVWTQAIIIAAVIVPYLERLMAL